MSTARETPAQLATVVGGLHYDPHTVLGVHPAGEGVEQRTLRPDATAVTVMTEDMELSAVRHPGGLFVCALPGRRADYRLRIEYLDRVVVTDDPYRWLPQPGELDLYLIGEGRHERLWEVLGAHPRVLRTGDREVAGTAFAVWAPAARAVAAHLSDGPWSGDNPMRRLGSSGVWELFLPGVGLGDHYAFAVTSDGGQRRVKADPLALATAEPSGPTCVVTGSEYRWSDELWRTRRAGTDWSGAAMSVYEVHLGSWRQGLGYRELAAELTEYVLETGFTHVELLPLAEHPYGGSWGYQVSSYYAPTSRFGTPDELRFLVDTLHRNGIGVFLDWVPAHFPRDDWALARFDGSPLYEHPDPRRGEHPDWGTLVFDFGRPEVRNFLVANALYWLDEFHMDGLRVDAVASMLYLDYSRDSGEWAPNALGGRENLEAVAFLRELTTTVGRCHPQAVLIAEESTAWPGVTAQASAEGLGFGLKWDMGWMHDTLGYLAVDPLQRASRHTSLTFASSYAGSERFLLPLSHDEVVHGKGSLWTKMAGQDDRQRCSALRAMLAYQWAHPGKQLVFMGTELGQRREWSDARSLDWELLEEPAHAGVRRLVAELNRVYRDRPALYSRDHHPAGFVWLSADDALHNVLSFQRVGPKGSTVVCVANFAGIDHEGFQLGLPHAGVWEELVNTDALDYGGRGVGNGGRVLAADEPWQGCPASMVVRLPASGVLWLAPVG